jgi:hypothetical protein
MKIGYNAYVLNKPITGVGRYLQALSYINSDFKKIAITPNSIFFWDSKFDLISSNGLKSKFSKLIWNFFHPLFIKEKFDIYHSPFPSLPFFLPKTCKKIITVHDLIFIKTPQDYPLLELLFIRFSLYFAVHKSDLILCVSNHTKNCLLDLYPNIGFKVHVVLNSLFLPDNIFESGSEVLNPVLSKLLNEKIKYFVLPSNRHPRKNIENTIKGFCESEFYKNNYKLVLCGIDESLNYYFDEKIIDVSYLSDYEYSVLLKNSQGVFYFSIDEGFGYPIIEAIKNNIPIYCSNIPSSLELFDEDASFLCADLSSSGIEQFLNTFYNSPDNISSLNSYLQLQKNRFSFDHFESQMINFYKGCI